ncbi:MAG: EF-hand domain pair [Sphingomonadales bacterium]|jgi:Ca2+-binding EF-hand superfamily protein|nr:EF-hand domain pair [Sphingomonadales bacterium]MEA3035649.1 EF-hand domain pair [Sphingomonadales bacterium]
MKCTISLALIIAMPCLLSGNTASHKSIVHSIGLIFRGTDTNHDGCLSRAEWKTAANKSIARRESRGAPVGGLLESYMDAFVQLDKNGDGCLTRQEYIRAAQRNMDEWNRHWNDLP